MLQKDQRAFCCHPALVSRVGPGVSFRLDAHVLVLNFQDDGDEEDEDEEDDDLESEDEQDEPKAKVTQSGQWPLANLTPAADKEDMKKTCLVISVCVGYKCCAYKS